MIKLGVKSYFSVTVCRKDGSVREHLDCTNVFTDAGILELTKPHGTCPLSGNLNLCVGTGTNEITETDVSLGTKVSTTRVTSLSGESSNYLVQDHGDGTGTYLFVRNGEFPLGTFNGEALSEVGAEEYGGGDLWAGQLIKDAGGTPVTVVVESDELLKVSYSFELRVPIDRTNVGTGTLDLNGTPIGFTAWAPRYFTHYVHEHVNWARAGGRDSSFHDASGSIRQYGGFQDDGVAVYTRVSPTRGRIDIPKSTHSPGQTVTGIKYLKFHADNGNFGPTATDWRRAAFLFEYDTIWDKPADFRLEISGSYEWEVVRM